MPPQRHLALLLCCAIMATPVLANEPAMLQRAFGDARQMFAAARPGLAAHAQGVDIAAYGDALTNQVFTGGAWPGQTRLSVQIQSTETGSCSRFAAFVRIPPQDGVVELVLCPEFFSAGTDGLRALTILHEMVHVVAGRDECQAMALAARIEQLAKGSFTPVDRYWQAQDCSAGPYSLP